MVEQQHQFPPYVDSDNDTSYQAAASVANQTQRMRQDILHLFQQRGAQGITCDELEVILGMLHQTASARIRELVKRGELKAKDYGAERIRRTRTGRRATVWVIV